MGSSPSVPEQVEECINSSPGSRAVSIDPSRQRNGNVVFFCSPILNLSSLRSTQNLQISWHGSRRRGEESELKRQFSHHPTPSTLCLNAGFASSHTKEQLKPPQINNNNCPTLQLLQFTQQMLQVTRFSGCKGWKGLMQI